MRPRLLLTYLVPMPFVREDLALLGEDYDVQAFHFDTYSLRGSARRALGVAALFLRQVRWLLRELPRAEVVVVWFADYHGVLPVLLSRLFGKPVAVVLAGFDSIHIPEMNYGVFASAWRAPLARFVLRQADLLLPCSETLIASESQFVTWPEARPQGVRAHVPGLDTPHVVVPFGYDAEAWPMGPAKRGRTACTVGLCSDDRTLRRKGIDLLFEVARLLPNVTFRVVGIEEPLQAEARVTYRLPDNVELVAPQPRATLPEIYGAASVYLQLSRAEGMPNVLAEAMLCGCLPVGSAVFGIPDVIGDAGWVVEQPDPAVIAEAVEAALGTPPEARSAARHRIAMEFTLERRRRTLVHTLDELRTRGPRTRR